MVRAARRAVRGRRSAASLPRAWHSNLWNRKGSRRCARCWVRTCDFLRIHARTQASATHESIVTIMKTCSVVIFFGMHIGWELGCPLLAACDILFKSCADFWLLIANSLFALLVTRNSQVLASHGQHRVRKRAVDQSAPGRTYIFDAVSQSDRGAVLRRSTVSVEATQAPSI